jgi:hypothetical protein
MDASKIAVLKKKLLEAKDFHEIVEYFFEQFGSDAAFARSGKPMNDQRFLTALAQVAATTTGEKGAFSGTPSRVAAHRLVHGAFTFGAWTVMMFYFEDVEQGFMALGDDSGPSRFTRFSFVATPDGQSPKIH